MYKAILLFAFIALAASHTRNPTVYKSFNEYILKYQKVYTTIEEYNAKYEVFEKNYNAIVEIQALHQPEKSTFEYGMSPFMDLTPAQFKAQYLTLNVGHIHKLKFLNERNVLAPKGNDAPAGHDWREHGAVSDVKDQGSCGSCWAFSSVGNVEGQYYLKTKTMVRFSEQQLVDCDKVDLGCNGGMMEDAFKYYQQTGVMAEADYAYTGSDDACKFDATKSKAKITGYKFAQSQNETEIAQMLFENGPLAVAINATPLQFYFGGIYYPWFSFSCDPAGLNHGVLIVGYGNDGSTDYWVVKNSWGSWWGESGYFRIIRGTGCCGINTYVISADVSPVA